MFQQHPFPKLNGYLFIITAMAAKVSEPVEIIQMSEWHPYGSFPLSYILFWNYCSIDFFSATREIEWVAPP